MDSDNDTAKAAGKEGHHDGEQSIPPPAKVTRDAVDARALSDASDFELFL